MNVQSLLPGDEPNVDDLGYWPTIPHEENGRLVAWCSILRNSSTSQAHTLLAQGMYVKMGE